MTGYDERLQHMRNLLLCRLENDPGVSDAEIQDIIDEIVLEHGRADALELKELEELSRDLFYSVRALDVLQELIDDMHVSEIMVNGCNDIFYEKAGKIYRFDTHFSDEERLRGVIQKIAGDCNKAVNEQSPIADARLKNGDRVNIVLPPVALDGPVLTIRRFPEDPITMDDLIRWGSVSKQAADDLKALVAAGYTIIVSGGTSTGKTTFLNALSDFIPKDERIVTIEDNAELQIKGIENLVRMETKPANLEENTEITIRDLIRTALRMRPSRIIVGEVRGAETADFLTCLNTGHSGSLGSVHANSAKDLVSRLEMMVRMGMDLPIPVIRSQIAAGVEIIVQLARDASGSRYVKQIAEITGYEKNEIRLRILYERDRNGELIKKEDLYHKEKLEAYKAYIKKKTDQ